MIEPRDAHRRVWSVDDDVAHAVKRRERRRAARRRVKRSSTWWWARSRRASTRSTLTSRPSRMIATRSQVFSTSDRMWLERKIVRPSGLGLADDLVERLLDERVEARRRLVEDQQVGPVLERDDQADLLLVALRVLLELAARVDVEARDQLGLVGRIDAAAQVGEVFDRLAAGQLVVERELARQVAEPPVDRDGIDGRVDAEDARSAGRRPDVVEQRPDRRRLAGAVGAEEAERLALLDDEVDVDDPAMAAVRLGEPSVSMTGVMACSFRVGCCSAKPLADDRSVGDGERARRAGRGSARRRPGTPRACARPHRT